VSDSAYNPPVVSPKHCLIVAVFPSTKGVRAGSNTYYGRLIGSLDSPFHALRGDVYAVDARTLFIKGFSYDGQGQGDSTHFCTSIIL
jgi:hypothetical protein